MKIGIVIPVMNNFRGAIELIWSAKSKHDLQVYIESQWIEPRKSLAQAWTDGAKKAFDDGCDYAIVCNDDILMSPDTIDALVEEYKALRHNENVIMVTPNNIKLELADPYHILSYERPTANYTFSEHPNFSCFCIAPEFFELVGTFDNNFYPAWFEDNNCHRVAQLLGYKLISTTASPQVHIGGVSTSMMPNPDSGVSQAYYIKKWGGLPASHGNPTSVERYATPYNNPNFTAKDWVDDYMGKLSRNEIDEQGNTK